MKRDRIIGYTSLGALLIFTTFCIMLIVHTVFMKMELWKIRFSNVGSLRIEDPVRIDGMDVAQITAIDYLNGEAVVTAAFENSPQIYANYSLRAVDVGVMGERLLALECGTPDHPLLTKRDTLEGLFVRGPSEALGVFSKLISLVGKLTVLSTDLLEGSPERASLIEQYAELASFIDSLGTKVLTVTRTVDRKLNATFAQINGIVDGAGQLSDAATRKLPGLIDTVGTTLETVDETLNKLDSLTTGLKRVMASLDGADAKKWNDLFDKLTATVASLRNTLDQVAAEGVRLKVLP